MPYQPTASTIFLVLILSQIAYALWDIISREVFDRHVHPFLPPLAFLALRTFLSAFVNIILAYCFEGSSPRRNIDHRKIKTERINKRNQRHQKNPFDMTPSASRQIYENNDNTEQHHTNSTTNTPSNWKLYIALNILSFLGLTISRVLHRTGVQLTTSTHAAAMQPLIAPATTVLVLAVGLETVSSKDAKGNNTNNYSKYLRVVFVPLLALIGSMVVVIGSGHNEATQQWHEHDSIENNQFGTGPTFDVVKLIEETTSLSLSNGTCGTILLFVQVLAFASFFVVQRYLLQWYKPIWLSALTFIMGAPQIAAVTYFSMQFWTGRQQITEAAAAATLYAKNMIIVSKRDVIRQKLAAVAKLSHNVATKNIHRIATTLSPSNEFSFIDLTASSASTATPHLLAIEDANNIHASKLLKGGHWEGKGTMPSVQRLLYALNNFPPETEIIILLSILYCVLASVFYMSSQTWAGCYVDTSTVALFVCVHPLATALFSTLILHRPWTYFDMLGGCIIGLAFWFEKKNIRKVFLQTNQLKRRLKWRKSILIGSWEKNHPNYKSRQNSLDSLESSAVSSLRGGEPVITLDHVYVNNNEKGCASRARDTIEDGNGNQEQHKLRELDSLLVRRTGRAWSDDSDGDMDVLNVDDL